MNINYRNAKIEDAEIILTMIKELAVYEKMLDRVVATVEDIEESIFGKNAKAFAVIIEKDGESVGFSVCFYDYSTFLARPGIYIEDVYVRPEHRGDGIGKGFFQYIAQRALAEKCGRINWRVLDWNEPSINFYNSLGAVAQREWLGYTLEGDAIADVANNNIAKYKKAS